MSGPCNQRFDLATYKQIKYYEDPRPNRAYRAVADWYDEIFTPAEHREPIHNFNFERDITCLVDYLALLGTYELEFLRREYDRYSPQSVRNRKSLRDRLREVEKIYDEYLEEYRTCFGISKLYASLK